MKDIIIVFTIVCFITTFLIVVDKKISNLEIQLIDAKEKINNDSILVHQYQDAMYEFMQKDPDCASKFQKILEREDTDLN